MGPELEETRVPQVQKQIENSLETSIIKTTTQLVSD